MLSLLKTDQLVVTIDHSEHMELNNLLLLRGTCILSKLNSQTAARRGHKQVCRSHSMVPKNGFTRLCLQTLQR